MNKKNDRTDHDWTDIIVAISDAEWENRRLCRDGNCIGVIGEDGRCRKCGLPWEEQEDGLPVRTVDHDSTNQGSTANPPEIERTNDADDAHPEWSKRILCSDGNCIGVIGRDGFCKTCGKPLETTTGTGAVNPTE